MDNGADGQGTFKLAVTHKRQKVGQVVSNTSPCPIPLRDGNLTQQAPESYCIEEPGKRHHTFS